MSQTIHTQTESVDAGRFLLWIDGVGGYLLCLSERMTIGGPADSHSAADLTLLANLSRRHATLVRSGEGYVLEPHASTSVGGRLVAEPTSLDGGYELRLGTSVRLQFRLPTVLSGTAVLTFVSDHRPIYSVDGVIMMEHNCLLGPGPDNHVVCPEASESIVLFRRDGKFWCKSRSVVLIDDKPNREGGPIAVGCVVSTADVRFRLEEMPRRN